MQTLLNAEVKWENGFSTAYGTAEISKKLKKRGIHNRGRSLLSTEQYRIDVKGKEENSGDATALLLRFTPGAASTIRGVSLRTAETRGALFVPLSI